MTKRALTKCCLSLLLLGAFCSYSPNAECATAVAPVNLTVETYLYVQVVGDIWMQTIYPQYFGQVVQTTGSAPINVACNVPAYVWCPDSVILTQPAIGSYTVNASVLFLGNAQAVKIGDMWRITYGVGNWPGLAVLVCSYEQLWTIADPAGTYTGTITLTIVAQ